MLSFLRVSFKRSEGSLVQSTVVDHRRAQCIGRGFRPANARRCFVRGAVVLNKLWVIDGDAGGALIEIRYGVSDLMRQIEPQSETVVSLCLAVLVPSGTSFLANPRAFMECSSACLLSS